MDSGYVSMKTREVVCFVFSDKGSLYNSSNYPETCSVAQNGLEFTGSTCLCFSSAGIKGMSYYHSATKAILHLS